MQKYRTGLVSFCESLAEGPVFELTATPGPRPIHVKNRLDIVLGSIHCHLP